MGFVYYFTITATPNHLALVRDFTQAIDVSMGFLLVGRLLALNLHHVYGRFCLFLISDLMGSVMWALLRITNWQLDYRIGWLSTRTLVWIFTLWTVYGLFATILKDLPGIARFSHRVLNFSFMSSILIGLCSAVWEMLSKNPNRPITTLELLSMNGIVVDRVIASVALLMLLSMLCFLLWFPVIMSRNLARFTVGFVVYFATKTALMLAGISWSEEAIDIVSIGVTLVSSACFAFWLVFIKSEGEKVRTKINVSWDPGNEAHLVRQLELLDRTLARNAQ